MRKKKHHGTRPIHSAEVYELANDVSKLNAAMYSLQFAVTRLKLAVSQCSANGGLT